MKGNAEVIQTWTLDRSLVLGQRDAKFSRSPHMGNLLPTIAGIPRERRALHQQSAREVGVWAARGWRALPCPAICSIEKSDGRIKRLCRWAPRQHSMDVRLLSRPLILRKGRHHSLISAAGARKGLSA